MASEEERCAAARRFQQINEAFHKGDLEALRAAVDDPAAVPNGRISDTIGSGLVYACSHTRPPYLTAKYPTRSDRVWSTRSITARSLSSVRCSRSEPMRTRRPTSGSLH